MTLPSVTLAPRPMRTFGEVVRDARVLAGFSLRDLAKQLSVQPSYLSDIELDRRTPSMPVMTSLAEALVLDVNELMVRSGRFDDATASYIRRHPSAGALLRLLAAKRVPDDALQTLLDQVERMGQP